MAGVFGLRKVYIQQASNAQGDDALELNIPGLNYGYIAGGYRPPNPGMLSSIERMDFGTETFSSPGNLVRQGGSFQCVSSENYGYFMGGQTPDASSPSSDISRLDFSNETSVDLGNIPSGADGARSIGSGGMQTPAYGYISGGAGTKCTITRIEFSTETVALNSAGSMSIKGQESGTVYSPSYGYIGSRFEQPPGPTGFRSRVDRFDFSVETCASLGNLSRNQTAYWAYQSQTTGKGYFGGGYLLGTGADCKIDRIDFATDTYTQAATSFPRANQANQDNGIGTDDAAYLCGGFSGASRVSTVDKLDFTTETGSTNSGTLATGTRQEGGGVSAIRPQAFKFVPGNNVWEESPNYGYTGGGQNPPIAAEDPTCTIDRMDFSSETISVAGSRLHFQRRAMTTITNSNFGYFAMGYAPPTGYSCKIDRLDYSTEVVSAPTSQSPLDKFAPTGLSAQEYGYLAGGDNPKVSTIARMDWANETMSTPTTLQEEKLLAVGFSTKNTGFIVGGQNPSSGYISTIEHLDFSTETTSFSPSTINGGRRYFAGTQNESFGYFSAGQGSDDTFSNIGRIELANDTTSLLSAELPTPTNAHTGYSNFSHGFYCGGQQPSVPTNSCCTINRLDFTTETVSSPSSQLTQARKQLAGMSGGIATRRVSHNSPYGYFGGGYGPNLRRSTIDRLDLATETILNPAAALSDTTQNCSSFTSGVGGAGYFVGGRRTPATRTCTIDRLDYSNETVSNPSQQLLREQQRGVNTSHGTYGYIAQGDTPTPEFACALDRFDFTTETLSPTSTTMLADRQSGNAVQSSTAGYYAGGGTSVTIDKLEFATETMSVNAGSLTDGRGSMGSTYNNNYGYFAGGFPGLSCVIDRLDFTTDSVAATPGQLSDARWLLGGTGNQQYGYFGGGAPGSKSMIDRLDFNAETVSTISQSLSIGRQQVDGLTMHQ